MKDPKEFNWWHEWREKYPERFVGYSESYPNIDREFVCYYPIDFRAINAEEIWEKKRIDCYVHIPFCRFICKFCCYSKFLFDPQKVKLYLKALKKEMETYSKLPYVQDSSIMALYFGGGTPSVLGAKHIMELMKCLQKSLNLEPDLEITIEAHPKIIDEEKMKVYLSQGINRISFGVQTFQDHLLKPPLFYHKRKDAIKAVETAKKTGFPRVGIDLLYRQPNQTLEDFQKDLVQAVEMEISSISCYSLLWPPNTPPPLQPSEELDVEMAKLATKYLTEHGYVQFATAEFALRGKECIYEKNYWHVPTPERLAFGAGAVSYIHGYIYANIHSLEGYIQFLEDGRFPVLMGKKLTKEEEMSRYMVLGLKCISVSKQKFKELYNVEIEDVYGDVLKKLENLGLVSIDDSHIKLTEKGTIYVDNVSKAFYTQNNVGKPQTVGMLLQNAMPEN